MLVVVLLHKFQYFFHARIGNRLTQGIFKDRARTAQQTVLLSYNETGIVRINLLATDFFFQILAHCVFKM